MATNSPFSGFGPEPCFTTVYITPLGNVTVSDDTAALTCDGVPIPTTTAAAAAAVALLVHTDCKKSARVDVDDVDIWVLDDDG